MAQVVFMTLDELALAGWVITRTPIPPDQEELNITKTFPDGIIYTETFAGLASVIDTRAATYGTAVEFGYKVDYLMPSDMFFAKSSLYQWITPQQMEQWEGMNPYIVPQAYKSALGLVYSQIGEYYDIPRMLDREDINPGTEQVLSWVMEVLTAYYICAASMKLSKTLEDNFQIAYDKLTEIKNGASTMNNAPHKGEPNAVMSVRSSRRRMLG